MRDATLHSLESALISKNVTRVVNNVSPECQE